METKILSSVDNSGDRVHIKKLLLVAILPLFLWPFTAHALTDSFQNVPDVHLPCTAVPGIGDLETYSQPCASTDGSGRPEWDISPYLNASNTYNLAVLNNGSASSTVTIANRFVEMWYMIKTGATPTCPPYIMDKDGNVYGTSTSPAGPESYIDGTAGANFSSYNKSFGGSSNYYSLCQYDITTPGTFNGLIFKNSASGIGILNYNLVGNGLIYALYSTASSTYSQSFSTATEFENYLDTLNSNSTSTTHIVSFTPNDGDVLPSGTPVNFTLNVYVHPSDVGTYGVGVRIILHNIDQNVVVSSLSNNDIELYNQIATTSGYISFATSTPLPDGNYRIEASINKSWLFGYLRNPFSSINDVQSHQFIVGTSTFLGHISQQSFKEMGAIFNSYSATSTSALSSSCNPISGFDTMQCMAFLFVPSNEQLNDSLVSFRQGIATKAPFGYFNRLYVIWQGGATTSLPTFTVDIPTGPDTHESVDFNPSDMLLGAGQQLDSVSSPINHVGIRDVLEPFVKLLISIAVIYTIITDAVGTHKHNENI